MHFEKGKAFRVRRKINQFLYLRRQQLCPFSTCRFVETVETRRDFLQGRWSGFGFALMIDQAKLNVFSAGSWLLWPWASHLTLLSLHLVHLFNWGHNIFSPVLRGGCSKWTWWSTVPRTSLGTPYIVMTKMGELFPLMDIQLSVNIHTAAARMFRMLT